MKTKSFFLTLMFITVTIMGSYAQGFHIGVKGGANLTKIDGQSFSQGFKLGYSLGGFAELNFTKKWGIQPELLWNQYNTTTAYNFQQIYEGFQGQNVSLNYLSIPILLTYRPVPILTFELGPQFGILMNQPSNLGDNISNAFKTGDFSVLGGAHFNLGAFKLGARYFVGLNDVNDLGKYDKWKNQGLQLYIGFRII